MEPVNCSASPTYCTVDVQFENLHAEHNQNVLYIIARYLHDSFDVDDCAQILWTRILQRLQAGESLNDPHNYIAHSARTAALEYRRAKSRRSSFAESLDAISAVDDETGGSQLDRVLFALGSDILDVHTMHRVRTALESLPARTQDIIRARFWRDLSVEEIASAFGISKSTVTSSLSRGYATLRGLLSPVPDQEAS